jgi:hypothetical protein
MFFGFFHRPLWWIKIWLDFDSKLDLDYILGKIPSYFQNNWKNKLKKNKNFHAKPVLDKISFFILL